MRENNTTLIVKYKNSTPRPKIADSTERNKWNRNGSIGTISTVAPFFFLKRDYDKVELFFQKVPLWSHFGEANKGHS